MQFANWVVSSHTAKLCSGAVRVLRARNQRQERQPSGADTWLLWHGLPGVTDALDAFRFSLGSRGVPFSMLQLALGASFLLVWLFIGGSMLSDRMAEVRRQRLLSRTGVANPPLQGMHFRGAKRRTGGRARAGV